MKKILAIETTAKYASVALLLKEEKIGSKDEVVFFKKSDKEMNHLVDLMKIIDFVLKKAGIEISDVDMVAPSIGPGSFTGIRIGVSTARALSQACGTGCIPVRTLKAMAELGRNREADFMHYACTIINARRNQTYAALWLFDESGNISEIFKQGQYMIDDLLDEISRINEESKYPVYFYGDGIDAYFDKIEKAMKNKTFDYEIAPLNQRYQSALEVAREAYEQIEMGKKPVDYDELLPDYMRKTEAEMKLEEGKIKINS